MELQLELLPYHYYNTLVFDPELIDYINHVDDAIVLEKIAPLYKNGGHPQESAFRCTICTSPALRVPHFENW